MGAKIEFYFLVKGDTEAILETCSKVLRKQEWTYNHHVQGEYTVWLDGPIWMLGKSRTIREDERAIGSGTLNPVLTKLTDGFSPSVVLGTAWFEEPLPAVLGIAEGEGAWKQLTFSVDWHEAFGRLTTKEKRTASEKFKTLFAELARRTQAYYGLGGIELVGIEAEPKLIDESSLVADFIFFSRTMVEDRTIQIGRQEYFVQDEVDGSVLLFRKDRFLEHA